MADKTGIEWTDATWNPLTGCQAVSPGCDNCYAASQASGRLSNLAAYKGLAEHGVFNGAVRLLHDRLDQPLRWKRPRRVFVNSMSDLFHPDVSENFIAQVFDVMGAASQHTFQVLTKRPHRMASFVDRYYNKRQDLLVPYRNVWLGTSIESQTYAFRARHLFATPAAVRFVSAEPLLGPLDLTEYLPNLDWVIVGGESGRDARPMHPNWARWVRDQCQDARVAFLFKQWGEWNPCQIISSDGVTTATIGQVNEPTQMVVDPATGDKQWMWRPGKRRAGRSLDSRYWDEYPS